jgi:hypothetical protein
MFKILQTDRRRHILIDSTRLARTEKRGAALPILSLLFDLVEGKCQVSRKRRFSEELVTSQKGKRRLLRTVSDLRVQGDDNLLDSRPYS